MNTVESTLTTADRAAIDAWLTEIRDLHAKLSTPILEGDPRMETFRKRNYSTEGLTPKELGESYLWALRPELPAWPLPVPSWAVEVDVMIGTYPEVQVQIEGRTWEYTAESGDISSARINQFATIFADDDDDMAEGGTYKRGDYSMSEPDVYVSFPRHESMPWRDAVGLAKVIEDCATELRDFLNS